MIIITLSYSNLEEEVDVRESIILPPTQLQKSMEFPLPLECQLPPLTL